MSSYLVGLIALILMTAGSSHAVLWAVDVNTSGDGLATRDTESGLDWLDLTQTAGMSYDAVVAGEGGFIADGWRPASALEACSLVRGTVFGTTGCPITSSHGGGTDDPARVQASEELINLLGVTSTGFVIVNGQVSERPFQGFDGFFSNADPQEVRPGVFGISVSALVVGVDWTRVSIGGLSTVSATVAATEHDFRGTYLVRVSPIPEPTTAMLVMLGLASLGILKRNAPQD